LFKKNKYKGKKRTDLGEFGKAVIIGFQNVFFLIYIKKISLNFIFEISIFKRFKNIKKLI
jgi:hypothetical protein